MATRVYQYCFTVLAVLVVFVAVCINGSSSSSSSDDDDKPKNYTCNTGDACDVDSDDPFAYLEGSLYCCREHDVISFTVNFDVKAALPNIEANNLTVSERVQEGFNCTCLDLGDKDLKERIKETFDDVKDKVSERWDDAKDWLDDVF